MLEPQLDQGSVRPGNLSFSFFSPPIAPQLQLSAAYELHVNYQPNLSDHVVQLGSCSVQLSCLLQGVGALRCLSLISLLVTAQPALI